MVSYDLTTGLVKVPLTDEAFKLRVINAKNTFAWAESINGLASHSAKGVFNNNYYWYVSATDKKTHQQVIAVAMGDNALGPFKDVLGKPLIDAHCEGDNINPTVIADDSKQSWLTWGTMQQLWYAKLNSDMMSFDSAAGINQIPSDKVDWFRRKINATVNTTEKRTTTYEEGPWLYKRNKLYYLFYPAGGVPEHLAYSTAPTATGPWTYRDTIMEVIKKGGAFTNHPGIVDYKNKTWLFYHNGALPGGGGFDRSVCVDELHFAADGSVPRIEPSAGIKKAVANINPFTRVEAETIAWEEGIKTETDGAGVFVTSIDNGDYIKIREVDFGKGATVFLASVASVTSGGAIEIRVDSLTGKVAGVCTVSNTGGAGKWKTVSAKVSAMKGIHDIYFVFKGNANDQFNFDWWRFKAK
jgi:hypothetical protein